MSRCHELDEYLDRAGIGADRPGRLTAHLTCCEACAGRWKRLSSAEAALRAVCSETVPPAPSLSLDFLEVQGTHGRPRGRWRLAAAGGLCLVALVAWHLRGPSGALVGPAAPHRMPERAALSPQPGTQQIAVVPRSRRLVVLPPRVYVAQAPAAAGTERRHHARRAPASPRRPAPAGAPSVALTAPYRGDDFVTVPRPVMAAVMSPASMHVVVEAMDEYRRARSVVDPRLAKLVPPWGAPRLDLLLRRLSGATGAAMSLEPDLSPLVPPGVGVGLRARDLMGRIAREMSLEWRRSGSPGAYAYRLLRSPEERGRLALEKRGAREERVVELLNGLNPYLEHRDSSVAELRSAAAALDSRLARTHDPLLERERSALRAMAEDPGAQAAARVLGRLSGDQFLALRRGERVTVTPADGRPASFRVLDEGEQTQLYADVSELDGSLRRIVLSRVGAPVPPRYRMGGKQ